MPVDAGQNKRRKSAGFLILLLAVVVVIVARHARERNSDFDSPETGNTPVRSTQTAPERIRAAEIRPENGDGRDDDQLPPPETVEEMPAAGKPLDFRAEETDLLCRRLADCIRAGESPEMIAISEELVRRGDAAADRLERLLQSGERNAEIVALRLLVRIGTPRALAAAIVRLCQAPGSDAQRDLLKTFGNARSRPVADAILDMAVRETRPEERRNLEGLLAAMEGPEITESLAERIRTAKSETELQSWLEALACLSKPSNVPGLENLLLDDPREVVQQATARTLAGIGDRRACWLLASFGPDVPSCLPALEQVRSPYAQETLREIAATAGDPAVQFAAKKALEQIGR